MAEREERSLGESGKKVMTGPSWLRVQGSRRSRNQEEEKGRWDAEDNLLPGPLELGNGSGAGGGRRKKKTSRLRRKRIREKVQWRPGTTTSSGSGVEVGTLARDERLQAAAGTRSGFYTGSLRRRGRHTKVIGEQHPMATLREP